MCRFRCCQFHPPLIGSLCSHLRLAPNEPNRSTQNTVAKKRAGQEDVDSGYLFANSSDSLPSFMTLSAKAFLILGRVVRPPTACLWTIRQVQQSFRDSTAARDRSEHPAPRTANVTRFRADFSGYRTLTKIASGPKSAPYRRAPHFDRTT